MEGSRAGKRYSKERQERLKNAKPTMVDTESLQQKASSPRPIQVRNGQELTYSISFDCRKQPLSLTQSPIVRSL